MHVLVEEPAQLGRVWGCEGREHKLRNGKQKKKKKKKKNCKVYFNDL